MYDHPIRVAEFMVATTIAIARQIGSDAENIAGKLSIDLDYNYYDYKIVQAAAKNAGASIESIQESERIPSFLTRIVESLGRSTNMPSMEWTDPVVLAHSPMQTSSEYRVLIQDVIHNLANQGSCILMGHGAPFILKPHPKTLRIFITCSQEKRYENIMKIGNLEQKDAEKIISDTDRERSQYFREFFGCDWLSPANYDLCLNTDNLSGTQAGLIIKEALQFP